MRTTQALRHLPPRGPLTKRININEFELIVIKLNGSTVARGLI